MFLSFPQNGHLMKAFFSQMWDGDGWAGGGGLLAIPRSLASFYQLNAWRVSLLFSGVKASFRKERKKFLEVWIVPCTLTGQLGNVARSLTNGFPQRSLSVETTVLNLSLSKIFSLQIPMKPHSVLLATPYFSIALAREHFLCFIIFRTPS